MSCFTCLLNVMTNKQYFLHLESHPVVLGEFEVSCSALNSYFVKVPFNSQFLLDVKFKGVVLPFRIFLYLSKRSIITDIRYESASLCKISPYELREWCPAIFLPYTNYLHWQKFLRIALEIFVESNPNILSSCACTL